MLHDRAMRMLAVMLLGAALLVCGALPALAQDVSPEVRADVLRLLKATGAEQSGLIMGQAIADGMVDMVLKQADVASGDTAEASRIAAIVKDEMGKVMQEQVPSLMSDMVPLYAQHFTREEIRGLLAFYESPLGRKATSELPQLMREGMVVGRAWGERIAPDLMARIEKRLQREGVKTE